MSVPERYDAIVIGSGQAGGPLASALANAGRRTALIERTHVGGTCINEGCTPTKTMVASARVAYLARRGRDYGIETGEVRVDLARVRERKRNIVESFRSGSERRIAAAKGLDGVTPAMLEGFAAAKVLVAGLKRAGPNPTRVKIQQALDGIGKFDIGGLEVSFSPGDHTGLEFVDLSIIGQDGKFRR